MATQAQVASFIAAFAPQAQIAYQTLGKVLPSVCIGMACVESAYGTAGSAKHHSYLGQKVGSGKTATKYWSGKFFTSKTSEEYTVGNHTVITAAFRAYSDMLQCALNYYELLNTSLYKRVQAGVDYRTQMQQIKACGYMTSSTEVNSVINIIEKYGLTKYDNVVGVVPVKATPVKQVNYAAQLKSDLNVRKGASTGYEKLLTLPKGMVVAICEEQGGWGRITDIAGWVSLQYVTKQT